MKIIIDKNAKGEIICNYSVDYDASGKIKEEKGLNENLTITNGETIMTYGKGNRLLTYNGQEVKYDADGNMTYGPLDGKMVEFKYDARNRLIEAGTTTYQYDAENNRIGQITNGEKTTYVVDTTSSALSRVLVEKKDSTVRQYIYATSLIMHVEGDEYTTYHYDNRGSTVAITNSQGTVTDTFTYGPYGEQCDRTGKTRTPFLYNGRYGVETDTNGLYYMRARYYNLDIKRFINQDVVQGSLDNAISLNRFAYANGNPISLIDPFGTRPVKNGAEGTLVRQKIQNYYQDIYKNIPNIKFHKEFGIPGGAYYMTDENSMGYPDIMLEYLFKEETEVYEIKPMTWNGLTVEEVALAKMSGKIFSAKAAQKYANAKAQLDGYIKAIKKQGTFKNPVAGITLNTKGVRIPYNDKEDIVLFSMYDKKPGMIFYEIVKKKEKNEKDVHHGVIDKKKDNDDNKGNNVTDLNEYRQQQQAKQKDNVVAIKTGTEVASGGVLVYGTYKAARAIVISFFATPIAGGASLLAP